MPLDLDAIRARCEAATGGPWRECGRDRGGCMCRQVSCHDGPPIFYALADKDEDFTLGEGVVEDEAKANARFVAHARTDIPALLAHIARLEADAKRLDWLDSAKPTMAFDNGDYLEVLDAPDFASLREAIDAAMEEAPESPNAKPETQFQNPENSSL